MFQRVRSLTRRRPGPILAAVVVTAIALRLLAWFIVVGFDTAGGGDEPDYHRIASDLATGRGFLARSGQPTATRPPLYPILLGGLYAVTGPDPDAARALQVVLGAGIVLLVYTLASRLFSVEVALLGAALAAVNPALVYLSMLLMTENLYILLLLTLLILLAPDHKRPPHSLSRFAAAGAVAGLCCLARATALAVASLIVVAMPAFAGLHTRGWLARAAVFLGVAITVLLPWSFRNEARLDDWVWLTTHGGITFYESNNRLNYEVPEFRGTVVVPRDAVPDWQELAGLPEVEFDRRAWRMGLAFVKENPGLFARMAWWKFGRFWRVRSGLDVAEAGPAVKIEQGFANAVRTRVGAGALYSVIVLPLFVVGLLATARSWRKLSLLYAAVVSHVAVAIALHGSLRARAPIEPVITIFAAAAAVWFARAWARWRQAAGGAT
jgi:4-amino-4-deoxy-L-arabinose transferase-like glycosyltransferase